MPRPHPMTLNIGFYLLILFALFISINPLIAYCLGAIALVIWISQSLIYRDADWIKMPLFYYLFGLSLLAFLAWAVFLIYDKSYKLPYYVWMPILYLMVSSFIFSGERRKMIVWTFITGVILASAFHLISHWTSISNFNIHGHSAEPRLALMVIFSFCLILGIYVESKKAQEKIFFILMLVPLFAVATLSLGRPVIMGLILLVLILGIIKDRTLLILFILMTSIILYGAYKVNNIMLVNKSVKELKTFVLSAGKEFDTNKANIVNTKFYGTIENLTPYKHDSSIRGSMFLRLLEKSGPFSLALFIWILADQNRRSRARMRKSSFDETRAFHFGIFLISLVCFIICIYTSVLIDPAVLCSLYLILGMSEV